MTPPSTREEFLLLDNPYGGFGLRTKNPHVAWSRVNALLTAVAAAPRWGEATLGVIEPVSHDALLSLVAPEVLEPNTSYSSGRQIDDQGRLAFLETTGHVHDAAVAAAIERLGAPDRAGFVAVRTHCERFNPSDAQGIIWTWTRTGDPSGTLYPALRQFDGELLESLEAARARLSCWVESEIVRPQEASPVDGSKLSLLFSLDSRRCTSFVEFRYPGSDPNEPAFAAFWDELQRTVGKLPPARLRRAWMSKAGNLTTRKLGWKGTGTEPAAFKAPLDPFKSSRRKTASS